ncbi:MAG TPA: NlpC/P60 family protein [Chitinophagaceae bacterium]|nr:NlpC/P60 family protein [Chitinophagaceae bacterium]HML57038.1 C40 family peptidase [Ferruginibacter sp.]
MMKPWLFLLSIALLLASCAGSRKSSGSKPVNKPHTAIKSQVRLKGNVKPVQINTRSVDPDELVTFAEGLVGVPYKYGGMSIKGMDCSGFIGYVFNKYNIKVPRISKDFTNAGRQVSSLDSRRGDLILFTGSNPHSGVVGHMGIITENKKGVLKFIHSASGGNRGVSITGMNAYFLERFVKIIRIFP